MTVQSNLTEINTIEDINEEKMYSVNEILPIFKVFGLPSSRPMFFVLRRKGVIEDKYITQYTQKGHNHITGKNLKKIIKKMLKG